jgi:DNA processing protein
VNLPAARSPVDTAAILALVNTSGASATQVARAVTRAGSARRVLEEGASCGQSRLFDDRVETTNLARYVAQLDAWQRDGIHVRTVLDADYPPNLLAVPGAPPLLYIAGAVAPSDVRAVAIVGTRQPTPPALARARRAAIALTDAGITVVSGLAAGIDTAAHVATLDAGGRTIAVIATGLQHVYPCDNADLQARIAKDGAVISQFPPDTHPARRNFPIRNAVTAGLALAVLLIEARPDSGSLITVRHTLRYGRPVYLPGSFLEHDWARQLATEPGVRVIDDPHQIAADFPPPQTSPRKSPENRTGARAAPNSR